MQITLGDVLWLDIGESVLEIEVASQKKTEKIESVLRLPFSRITSAQANGLSSALVLQVDSSTRLVELLEGINDTAWASTTGFHIDVHANEEVRSLAGRTQLVYLTELTPHLFPGYCRTDPSCDQTKDTPSRRQQRYDCPKYSGRRQARVRGAIERTEVRWRKEHQVRTEAYIQGARGMPCAVCCFSLSSDKQSTMLLDPPRLEETGSPNKHTSRDCELDARVKRAAASVRFDRDCGASVVECQPCHRSEASHENASSNNIDNCSSTHSTRAKR